MGEKGRPWGLPFWFGGSRERLWRAAVGRGFRWDRRRSRPAAWFPARLRAGARLSPEKAGGKSAGGVAPWTPFFMARSFSLAGFGVVGRSVPVDGLLRNPWTCPDLETFFRKMLSSIFSLENASQIGLGIPEETAPLSYQRQRSPKRASESERAINPGSRGLPLVFFPPTFFKESRAPPPESAGNPRCRVHPATVPTEPPIDDRGPPRPHIGSRWTRAAMARAARTPEAPAWARPRVIPAPSPAAKKLGRAVSRSGESFSRAE